MTAFSLGEDVIAGIKKYAPYLGELVSSVSPIGGVAVSLVEHALGVAPGDAPALASAITTDPDLQIKLETIERELQQIDAGDRADARAAKPPHDWIIPFLAVVFVLGFFGFIGLSLT